MELDNCKTFFFYDIVVRNSKKKSYESDMIPLYFAIIIGIRTWQTKDGKSVKDRLNPLAIRCPSRKVFMDRQIQWNIEISIFNILQVLLVPLEWNLVSM